MAWIKTLHGPKAAGHEGSGPKDPNRKSPPPRVRKKKSLIAPEDHALWVHVTRSAKPMPGRQALDMPVFDAGPQAEEPPRARSLPLPVPVQPKVRTLPPLAGIEKRMVKEVARGSRAIDARIDLHGMRQAEAHGALNGFLHRAHANGAKLVLVITGKGGGIDGFGEERGVLKRMVPHWLADPVLRRLVIGFENAGRGHGGEGALYVRLRRMREHG